MCMNVCLHIFMCPACMPTTYTGQKRGLDTLELALQMVVNQYVCTGNQTLVLCKSNKFS